VRITVPKPKARANDSARARFGFSNSSQAMSATLITGFRDRPECLTHAGSLLAVQVIVGADTFAHNLSLTD
jgi:hypothetical protein